MIYSLRILLLLVLLFVFSGGQQSYADDELDVLLSKWNTFSNSKALKNDYVFEKKVKVGDNVAYVLSYENPQNKNRRYYRYIFQGSDGAPLYEISLGSYDFTTNVEREMDKIGPDDRVFHLDAYCADPANDAGVSKWGSHRTLAFYNKLPNFDKLTEKILKSEENTKLCGFGDKQK